MNPQGWKECVGEGGGEGRVEGGQRGGDQRCEMLKTTAEYNTGLAVVSARKEESCSEGPRALVSASIVAS